jgi:hypothetical protein
MGEAMKKAIPVLKSLWFLLVIALVFGGREIYFPALVLTVALALLAPIIRELLSKAELDERQIQISHYSSHIAYFVYTFLLIFALIREWVIHEEVPTSLIFVLLAAPLATKMTLCMIQNYGGVSGLSGFLNLFFRGLLPAKKLDERQAVIGNLSSHVAFYVFLTLTLVVVLYRYVRLNLEPAPLWDMLLFVPLVSKLYVSYFQTYDAAKGARYILSTIAGLVFIFVLLSHGLSLGALLEALPFLLMAGIIYLSKWAPKLAGIIVMLVAIAMLVLMHGWMSFDVYVRILMWTLIPIPLILCGLALMMEQRERTK